MKLLMDTVDDLSQDTVKYLQFQKGFSRQQQMKRELLIKRVSLFHELNYYQCAVSA